MTVLNCEIPIIYEALIYVDLVSQLNHQCVVNETYVSSHVNVIIVLQSTNLSVQ